MNPGTGTVALALLTDSIRPSPAGRRRHSISISFDDLGVVGCLDFGKCVLPSMAYYFRPIDITIPFRQCGHVQNAAGKQPEVRLPSLVFSPLSGRSMHELPYYGW